MVFTALLTTEEYHYLISFLKRINYSKELLLCVTQNKNFYSVLVDEDSAIEVRELLADEVINHFDYEYRPTKKGLIIESLIDKLYDE